LDGSGRIKSVFGEKNAEQKIGEGKKSNKTFPERKSMKFKWWKKRGKIATDVRD